MLARNVLSWLLLALLVSVSGCNGGDDDDMNSPDGGGPPDASATCIEATMHSDFTWINDNIFQRSCALSTACHRGANPQEDLNLMTDPYNAIVNVPSVQQPTLDLIEPGDPDNSYLYIKMGRGDQSKLVDELMPFRNPTLCDEKLDAIERWINAGAPND